MDKTLIIALAAGIGFAAFWIYVGLTAAVPLLHRLGALLG